MGRQQGTPSTTELHIAAKSKSKIWYAAYLAGRPLSQNNSLDCFAIHPLRGAFVLFRRSLKAVNGDEGRCPSTLQAFEKA